MYRKSGVMAKTLETCQPDLDTRAVGSFWPDNPGDDIVICEHNNNPARIAPFWMDYHGRKKHAARGRPSSRFC